MFSLNQISEGESKIMNVEVKEIGTTINSRNQ